MPIYEYIEQKTGARVELLVPMAERDRVPGHRRLIAIMPSVIIPGQTANPHTQEAGMLQGLRDLEDAHVPREQIEAVTGFTANQLKAAAA